MFAVDIGCMFYLLAIAGVKNETKNLSGLGTANVCRRSYVKIRECEQSRKNKYN